MDDDLNEFFPENFQKFLLLRAIGEKNKRLIELFWLGDLEYYK